MWGRYKDMGTDFGRLYALSDGVFSIVMTILTFSIQVPKLPAGATDGEVLSKLSLDAHAVLGYIVSYFVVGVYWIIHHRIFRMINRYDRRLLWRNLYFLFLLTLLPFTTSLSTSNSSARLPWALYCANVVLLGVCVALLWHYASITGHVDPEISDQRRRAFLLRSLVSPVVFMVSMAVCVFDVHVARYVIFLIVFLGRIGKDLEEGGEPPAGESPRPFFRNW